MNHSLRRQGLLLSHLLQCSLFLMVVLMVIIRWTTLKATAQVGLRGTDLGIATSQSLSSTSTILSAATKKRKLQTSLLCDPLICPNGTDDINNPKCQDCFHLNDAQQTSSATGTKRTQEEFDKCLPKNILETSDKDLQIFKHETIPWKMTLSYEIQALVDIHDNNSSKSTTSGHNNAMLNNNNRQVIKNIVYDIKEYVALTVLAQYLNGTTCPSVISDDNIDLSSTRNLLFGASIKSIEDDNDFINVMTTDTVAALDSCTITTTNDKDYSTYSACFAVDSDILLYVNKEHNTVNEKIDSIVETFVGTYIMSNNNLHNNIIHHNYPHDITGFTFLNIQMTMIEWPINASEERETPTDLENNKTVVDSKTGRIENISEVSSENGEQSSITTNNSSLHIWLPSMIVAVITIVVAIVSVLLLHIKKKRRHRRYPQDHVATNKQQTLEDLDNTSSSVSSDVAIKDSGNVASKDPEMAIITTTTISPVMKTQEAILIEHPSTTTSESTSEGGQDKSKISSWLNDEEEFFTNTIPTTDNGVIYKKDSTKEHPSINSASSLDKDNLLFAPSFDNNITTIIDIPFALSHHNNDNEQKITKFNTSQKNDKNFTSCNPTHDEARNENDKEDVSHLKVLFETNEPSWMKQEQQQEHENNDEATAKVNYHADDKIKVGDIDNVSFDSSSSSSSSSSDASSWSSVYTNKSSNTFDTSNHCNNDSGDASSSMNEDDPFHNVDAVSTTVPSFEERTNSNSFLSWTSSLHER